MLSKSYLFWGLKVVAPEMKEKALPEHHELVVPQRGDSEVCAVFFCFLFFFCDRAH